MGSTSHAYLPAMKVMNACSEALSVIASAREALKAQLIADMRERSWPLPKRSAKKALKEFVRRRGMTVVSLLKRKDFEKLDAMMSLSGAAHFDDPEARVFIDLPDFKLIEAHYKLEKSA